MVIVQCLQCWWYGQYFCEETNTYMLLWLELEQVLGNGGCWWFRLRRSKIIPGMGDCWTNNVLGNCWYDGAMFIVCLKGKFWMNGSIAHLQRIVFWIKVLLSEVRLS